MGFGCVALNLLELTFAPGWDVIAEAGGLHAWTGWPERLVAVAWGTEPRPSGGAVGWRARRRPEILSDAGDQVRLRSPVDGAVKPVSRDELFARAALDGAEPPPTGWTVTSEPMDRAREGLYLTDNAWRPIAAHEDAAEKGPLVPGCGCPTCAIAQVGYIGHLWRQREITAAHLLGRHNLHALRAAVQG